MGCMRKRIKLIDRRLPDYSKGEEIMNMVTHITGGALGIAALVLCVVRAALRGGAVDVVGAVIYGVSLIGLYTMSSVYHGLRPGMGKKVLQVLDHCTIYFLIAGSYTPVALSAIRPLYPALGLGLAIGEWALTALAVTLTAIDLRKYRVFSMICYIGMGWAVLPFAPQGHGGHGTDRVCAAFGWRDRLHPGLHFIRHWREEKVASLCLPHLCGFGQCAALFCHFLLCPVSRAAVVHAVALDVRKRALVKSWGLWYKRMSTR